jgi:hypothetical protein
MSAHHEKLIERRKRNLEDQLHSQTAATASEAAADGDSGLATPTPTPRKKRNPPPQSAVTMDNFPDPYRKEIEVLAQIRAYNEVAQKRFVDNVYMSIQGELVHGFGENILEALQNGLGLNRPDGMYRFTPFIFVLRKSEKSC